MRRVFCVRTLTLQIAGNSQRCVEDLQKIVLENSTSREMTDDQVVEMLCKYFVAGDLQPNHVGTLSREISKVLKVRGPRQCLRWSTAV